MSRDLKEVIARLDKIQIGVRETGKFERRFKNSAFEIEKQKQKFKFNIQIIEKFQALLHLDKKDRSIITKLDQIDTVRSKIVHFQT